MLTTFRRSLTLPIQGLYKSLQLYQCPFLTYLTYNFSHRLLWHRTWPRAVAFQPLSTRYETERPDSPIEGFVFRLWQWEPDVGDTFTAGKNPTEKTYVSLPIVFIYFSQNLLTLC